MQNIEEDIYNRKNNPWQYEIKQMSAERVMMMSVFAEWDLAKHWLSGIPYYVGSGANPTISAGLKHPLYFAPLRSVAFNPVG